MATNVSFTKDQYFCRITNREETLTIKCTTTVSKPSRMVEKRPADSFTNMNIEDCTGLGSCGVKTSHGMGATFDWDRCPALKILKTR